MSFYGAYTQLFSAGRADGKTMPLLQNKYSYATE